MSKELQQRSEQQLVALQDLWSHVNQSAPGISIIILFERPNKCSHNLFINHKSFNDLQEDTALHEEEEQFHLAAFTAHIWNSRIYGTFRPSFC